MHISRRTAAIGAAVFTGLASLGAVGAASASPAAYNRVQVLRLHAVFVPPAVVNHAGHRGPGDVTAVVFDLQTPGGAEAGKAYASCTQATASESLCHAAYVLKGGQIDVQVAVSFTGGKKGTWRSPAARAPTRGSPAGSATSTPDQGHPTGRST
jgi:hypothetical protein